jgi:hypothetical protein
VSRNTGVAAEHADFFFFFFFLFLLLVVLSARGRTAGRRPPRSGRRKE